MGHGGRSCRHCGAPIEFVQGSNNRWTPVTPGTEERHECPKVTVYCDSCRKPFKGASWMKQCPECYKGGRSSRSSSGDASPPRTKERLDPGGKDDVPF